MINLDNINKFKRVQSAYTFVDTLIDGAFNIASAPLKTSTWIVVQLMFNLFLSTQDANIEHLHTQKVKMPQAITSTTPKINVYQSLLSSATKTGKEYLKEVSKVKPIKVKSQWIDSIWFVPNPDNLNLGSLGITFIGQTTNNKPPVLTPPWFSKQTFNAFKSANSKGRFYLDKVAILKIGTPEEMALKVFMGIGHFTLLEKFSYEATYYQQLQGLYDDDARAKIIANSNQWEKMFSKIGQIKEGLKNGGQMEQINSVIALQKVSYYKHMQEAKKMANVIQEQLNKKRFLLSKIQTLIKQVARGVRNPKELIKNETKLYVRSKTPYAVQINRILDVYKRKGANFKQLLKHRSKKTIQAKMKRYQLNQIEDKIRGLVYLQNKAKLKQDQKLVLEIDDMIMQEKIKYAKIRASKRKTLRRKRKKR